MCSISSSTFSSHTEQQLHGQLIEALVAEPPPPLLSEPRDQRLDIPVRIPLSRTLAQDQVGPHAAAREVAHAIVILRPVGVGVEMAWAGVADVFEELDEPERRLQVGRSEPQVLVVAAWHLIVQVDVK